MFRRLLLRLQGELYLMLKTTFTLSTDLKCRSQWLRRRSTAPRLLRLWVRIPPGAWMFVCCECCVLSGRGLCDGLITRPEESYRLWRVIVCDQETSKTRRLKPATGAVKIQPQRGVTPGKQRNEQILRFIIHGFKLYIQLFKSRIWFNVRIKMVQVLV